MEIRELIKKILTNELIKKILNNEKVQNYGYVMFEGCDNEDEAYNAAEAELMAIISEWTTLLLMDTDPNLACSKKESPNDKP